MELNPVLEPGEEPRENLWYVISSPTNEIRPSKRSGHQLTKSGHLVGGATPDGLVKDSYYKLNLDTQNWDSSSKSAGDTSEAFGMIEHYAGETVEKKLVVFNSANDETDQILKVGDSEWSSLNCVMLPRTSHEACAILPNDSLVIFSGGYQGQEIDDKTIYSYSLSENKILKKISEHGVSNRQGHTISYLGNNKVAIFGGMANVGEFFNDTWVVNFDTNTVEEIKSSVSPTARASHSAAGHENCFYIHGGLSLDVSLGMPQPRVLDDIWRFDVVTECWSEISKLSDVALPTPRLSHSLTVMKLPVYKNIQKTNTDAKPEDSKPEVKNIVELDNWRAVTEDNLDQVESVCERDNSNIVIEKYVDVLAVFGGMDLEGHFYNDLMVLKL